MNREELIELLKGINLEITEDLEKEDLEYVTENKISLAEKIQQIESIENLNLEEEEIYNAIKEKVERIKSSENILKKTRITRGLLLNNLSCIF